MSINKPIRNRAGKYPVLLPFLIALLFYLHQSSAANQAKVYVGGAKGLEIKIIRDARIDLVYAELLIFYDDKAINPAIPYLTFQNIFNPAVNRSGSGLLTTLKRLGSDYEVLHRPDYLLFRIHFLPDRLRLSTFAQFLKGLYAYKAFTLKKFNHSTENFWTIFLESKDWKKQAAFQAAYGKLFPGHLLGNILVLPDDLKKINLAQIRSFHQRTYTPERSLLIMKGNLKPALVVGSISRALKALKPQGKREPKAEKLTISDKGEVIIYHIDSPQPPEIYWFEAIPPLGHEDHIPSRLANDVLFAPHIGRLSLGVLANGIRISRLDTEIIHHKEVSLICNIVRLNYYRDIEKFVLLADNEKRKLRTRRAKIERREYLDIKNYFSGQVKVKGRRFEDAVERERNHSLVKRGSGKENEIISEQSIQELTLDRLNGVASNLGNRIIVLVGNAQMIMRHLSTLKRSVIRFSIRSPQ